MDRSKPLLTTEDVLPYLKFIRNKKQEYFICLSLDGGHRLIARRTVTIGLVNMSLAHPREVFAGPIKDRATCVIIAHNHPSGDPNPSREDIKTTQQLIAAGQLLGVRVYDHVIIAGNENFGIRSKGYMD